MAELAILMALGVLLTGCFGGNDTSGGSKAGGSINVAIVDTPNTQDLARLTPS
jgi:hypothetical protein